MENAVRDLQLTLADLGVTVRGLLDAQGRLSESVQGRVDALGGTILGIGQNMDAHAQLLQKHDEMLTTFKAGCKVLAGEVERVEQQTAETANDMHLLEEELERQMPSALTSIHDEFGKCNNEINRIVEHAKAEFTAMQRRVEGLQGGADLAIDEVRDRIRMLE